MELFFSDTYSFFQAISRVTQVISDGQYGELNGLLTKAAKVSLMRELDRNWSERQRGLLQLSSDDIQISSPRKVYFIRIAGKSYNLISRLLYKQSKSEVTCKECPKK